MERSKSGHAAGLRTTLLVTLAASVAMIQMNLLMQTNGKPPTSYAVMDLMRLPLGILTGVGFIGAGAIVRKNELVLGLTTAATLWFATVVGLCLGGGQLILGCTSAVIGWLVLWQFSRIEKRVENYQAGEIALTVERGRLHAEELRARLQAARFRIRSLSVTDTIEEGHSKFDVQVQWPAPRDAGHVPEIVAELRETPGLITIQWREIRRGPG
jgi:putative Mg2+ transporter-C (MgtC) family protein